MIKRRGFTRIDLIIALACAVFVFVNAQVIIAGGREKAKQEVCMANLRMLTAAWQIYAEDNAGKLVNGAPMTPGGTCPDCPENSAAMPPTGSSLFAVFHKNEIPSVGPSGINLNGYTDPPANVARNALFQPAHYGNMFRTSISTVARIAIIIS